MSAHVDVTDTDSVEVRIPGCRGVVFKVLCCATPLLFFQAAVKGADLVVCATPSREPLITDAAWLAKGVTVVALGSDGPGKLELAPHVSAGFDKIVTDLTSQVTARPNTQPATPQRTHFHFQRQCVRLGELHHAVEKGGFDSAKVHAELGEVVIGRKAGREGEESILVDLTGVGVQDAGLADSVWKQVSRL